MIHGLTRVSQVVFKYPCWYTCLLVPDQKINILTIYGYDGHLGYVAETILSKFHWPILCRPYVKYDFKWPSSFYGKQSYSTWQTLSQDHWMTLTIDIYCCSCSYLLHSICQLSYHRLQYFCFTFSHSKAKRTKPDLMNWVMVYSGSLLYHICWTSSTWYYISSLMDISPLVLEKKLF